MFLCFFKTYTFSVKQTLTFSVCSKGLVLYWLVKKICLKPCLLMSEKIWEICTFWLSEWLSLPAKKPDTKLSKSSQPKSFNWKSRSTVYILLDNYFLVSFKHFNPFHNTTFCIHTHFMLSQRPKKTLSLLSARMSFFVKPVVSFTHTWNVCTSRRREILCDKQFFDLFLVWLQEKSISQSCKLLLILICTFLYFFHKEAS